VPDLHRLTADQVSAVLAFELANRSYFSATISDRGDEFFEDFASAYAELLAEQDTGQSAYFVLVAEDGAILGRFNLRDIANGSAVLGYRVAENVAGHGVATTTVDQLGREAATTLGLRTAIAQDAFSPLTRSGCGRCGCPTGCTARDSRRAGRCNVGLFVCGCAVGTPLQRKGED